MAARRTPKSTPNASPNGTAPGTRDRILDAAQRLFADHGFRETSLRAITAEAGVNLAAVNYHFGSKEALIGEVFGRLVRPVNEERLSLLDRAESGAGDGPLPLDEVVDAFLAPVLAALKRLGPMAIRLMGRTYAESSDQILRSFKREFGQVVERFAAAFQRALPEIGQTELLWRLQFSVGALVHTMVAHDRLKTVFPDLEDPLAAADLNARLKAFICGGMSAPAAGGSRPSGRGVS